jgi:polysaccharide export outer membrane protein
MGAAVSKINSFSTTEVRRNRASTSGARLRVAASLALMTCTGVLASQQTARPAKSQISQPAVDYPNAPAAGDYKIGNGDVLHVSVWGQDQFDRTVTVRPDGKVSLPLVEDITIAGLTVTESQDLLRDKLLPFVKRPLVTVNVTDIRSKVVYVTGEVQRPGAYVLTAPTNLLQIVARAGGVTDFAKTKKVYVFHTTGDRVPVNLKDLIRGRGGEQDVALAPGDTVLIP